MIINIYNKYRNIEIRIFLLGQKRDCTKSKRNDVTMIRRSVEKGSKRQRLLKGNKRPVAVVVHNPVQDGIVFFMSFSSLLTQY